MMKFTILTIICAINILIIITQVRPALEKSGPLWHIGLLSNRCQAPHIICMTVNITHAMTPPMLQT